MKVTKSVAIALFSLGLGGINCAEVAPAYQTDNFGNSFYYDSLGDYVFFGSNGDNWSYIAASGAWSGYNSFGESWFYSASGQQDYWDSNNNHWEEAPNGVTYFYDTNGDYAVSYTNGTNVFFDHATTGGFNTYNYEPNGQQNYQGANGDWWNFNPDTSVWQYFDSSAGATFGSQGSLVYVLDSDGSVFEYDKSVQAFQYTSPNGQENVNYYPLDNSGVSTASANWYSSGKLAGSFTPL